MSRVLAVKDFHTVIPDWRCETTDPNAGSGTAEGLGSVWLRQGNYPTIPEEVYFKLNATNKGWAKQNLVNLKVLNVTKAPYNCVPDGVSDCGPGVRQAVADAKAAGGGIIYFPAAASFYRFAFFSAGSLSTIPVIGCSNIMFMGDGWASQLQINGDMGTRFQCLISVTGGSHHISFYNLRLSGVGITNADPALTSSLLEIAVAAGDVAPPHHVDIDTVWFDPSWADGVRPIGEGAFGGMKVTDVRVVHCMFNMQGSGGAATYSRDCISAQRNVSQVIIANNWFAPCGSTQDGQQIDFEPGGGDQPTDWDITGNVFQSGNQLAITTSGVDLTHPSQRVSIIHNIFENEPVAGRGCNIEGIFTDRLLVHGNIMVLSAVTTTGFDPIECRNLTNSILSSNIISSEGAVLVRGCFFIYEQAGGGNPQADLVVGNLCKCVAAASNISAIRLQAMSQFMVEGNLVFINAGAATGCSGVQYRSTSFEAQDNSCNGNLINALTAQTLAFGVSWSTTAPAFDQHYISCSYNLLENCQDGIQFDSTGANFQQWRVCSCNNCPGNTVINVSGPGTNVGDTIDGSGTGPAGQIATVNLAAGPATKVAASPGSACLNTLGAQATILWYKETGASSTAGWLQTGGYEYAWGAQAGSTATAARFFAPGIALAAEGTVEIKEQVVRPGTLRNLRVQCVAGTGGGNNTYRVRKNGVDTNLLVTITNTGTNGSNAGNTVPVVAGDLMSVDVTKTVAPTTAQTFIVCTYEMTG